MSTEGEEEEEERESEAVGLENGEPGDSGEQPLEEIMDVGTAGEPAEAPLPSPAKREARKKTKGKKLHKGKGRKR